MEKEARPIVTSYVGCIRMGKTKHYIVCLKIDGGGYVYWTGYQEHSFLAKLDALEAINFNGDFNWIAENPVLSFDVEDD